MADRQKTVELEVSVEVLHHDHDTMNKVYAAIWKAMGIEDPEKVSERSRQESQNIVSEIQNAGILFRERKPNG